MSDLPSPLQLATVGSALVWPLTAGVAVVVWSKLRSTARARRVAAMEGQLQDLYQTLEAAPVPPQLALAANALEEGQDLPGDAARP